ncbi:hypothetical protein E8E13_001499 [Curvularia kusanoi]|uniref:Alpha/beta hydrolase fold-3 domain-containing protein n=1 Tax=Curvularia kusanoi TaxID=90978 RepID=A0A9P4T4W5_CURKU|nr:hypothetical protein E8E13_001499 [Curvularia kusanoi]
MTHQLDPLNQSFVDTIAGGPDPHILGYEGARKALEDLQKHETATDIVTETVYIPAEGGSTTVVIFRSTIGPKVRPVVFYAHGGGWIMGSPTSCAPMMEDLARQSGAAIVFPYYTPAPDKQYPFQFEQTYKALAHIVRYGDDYNLQTESLVLAGDSAGGHMVIAIMQMAMKRTLPAKVSHMILFYPCVDTHMKMQSYETYKDGPFLPSNTMDWMIAAFIPNKKDRENGLTSPLSYMSDENLSRFPPTTVILAEVDPLVDEGRAFGLRLQRAGVDTAVIRAEGQIHAFALVKPIRESATSRAILELVAYKIRKALALIDAP